MLRITLNEKTRQSTAGFPTKLWHPVGSIRLGSWRDNAVIPSRVSCANQDHGDATPDRRKT